MTGEDLKVEELTAGKPEAAPVVLEVAKVAPKTWAEFLLYLRQVSISTATNLEQGNLLYEVHADVRPLSITVAFPQSAAVFHEYLEDKEIYARLRNHMADFFEVSVEELKFRTQVITDVEIKDKNFRTKVEIDDELKSTSEETRRQKILNDPFVREAEKLFNAKVDKVILNE